MSSREDTNQKAKKRHRSRSPERGVDKRGDRHRSRSKDRGDKKRSDRHRSRSKERGADKKSDRHEKKSTRTRSRSRSKSRDRAASSKSHREKDRDNADQRNRDSVRSIGETKTKIAPPVVAKSAADLEKDRETQKEEEQAVLDDEMRKRRERVKAWQDEKSKRIADEAAVLKTSLTIPVSSPPSLDYNRDTQDAVSLTVDTDGKPSINSGVDSQEGQRSVSAADAAGWSLEDDDEDDKGGGNSGEMDEVEMMLPSPLLTTTSTSSQSGVLLFSGPKSVAVFDIGGLTSPSSGGLKSLKGKRERAPSMSISSIGSPKKLSTDTMKTDSTKDFGSVSLVEAKAELVTKSESDGDTSSVVSMKTHTTSNVELSDSIGVERCADLDPLDDFMSSLYGEGEVQEQQALPSDLPPEPIGTEKRGESLPSSAPSSSEGNNAIRVAPSSGVEGEGDESAMVVDESGSVTDDDYDEYSYLTGDNPRVNPFGSNFITLDQILGVKAQTQGQSPQRASSSSGAGGGRVSAFSSRMDYSSSGWESDSAPASPMLNSRDSRGGIVTGRAGETEEQREEREDKERKEFIDAIRAARAAEDVVRERLKQKDDAAEKSKEQLGRVFAGEGDVMDEMAVEEKKKSALEILEDAKRGKELKPVDHKTVEYIPFRKNLYIVPRALSRLTEEDLVEKREDLQIKVRGKGCPAPVDTWGQCGLSERVLGVIEKLGLTAPFAIQKQAIPAIMCGRDIIGVAKTGSGKTLAFLLPMFRHIMDQPPLRDQEGPIGLVMAPARELAFQIFNEAKKFSKALGIRVACVYGGAGVADQIADLKRGAEIVVCTPGRMIDILCMQAGKLVNLRRVTMVVLDEADRCFDMGFAPQIEMVLQNIRPDRQTVLFSATFPKQIEKLAKTVLRLPLEVVVGERSSVNKDITQVVEVHDDADKFMRLLQLLGVWYEKGSVLVFVDTQEKCDQLFHDLLKSGYPCLSLHGGKDQLDRDHTLHEFKKSIKTVMVATSVAGRGLDVPDIVVVVNYNCPNHIEDYVHRVGRTGRAGRKGTAYTFISPSEEQYSPLMIKALEKAGQAPAPELLEMVAAFKEKVSRGEARYSSSGFEGKGFTFDASEMSETQKNASLQRKAYDIEQGIEEKGEDEDEEGEEGEKNEKGEKAGTAAAAAAEASPLDRARAIATSLCLSKGLPVPSALPLAPPTPAPSTSISLGADGRVDSKAALMRAKLIASQLAGAKLVEGAEAKETAHFEDELDINDYPPQARRKVTHKNALDDISEQTGVAITARGTYVPPGKKLEVGERRLFLLIEGSTDLQVRQAKLEIVRLLDEETMRLGASGNTSFGRYAVL